MSGVEVLISDAKRCAHLFRLGRDVEAGLSMIELAGGATVARGCERLHSAAMGGVAWLLVGLSGTTKLVGTGRLSGIRIGPVAG